ncbi:MAG: D-2-hydroxyacid dehydrogenase [Sulfitobacter sp.]
MTQAVRVLIHTDDTAPFAKGLRARFPDVDVAECTTYADLPSMVARFCPEVVYTVRFAGTPGYPRAALFQEGGPRWIANGGAGTDHFGFWDPAHCTVTNAAGVAADVMAEYVIGGFLHFTLDVPGLQEDKAARRWQARRVDHLKGKTLLIIGLGHTGRAIAARAQAFGMKVIGTRATPQPMEHVDEVHSAAALLELVPQADFIAVCTPLTPGTRGALGRVEFTAMKRGVYVADVSRGGVVDQSALFEALTDGTVAGAALDVFETEPLPLDSPFWTLPNVLISPHCSSVYEGWAEASFELFLSNLERWIAGETLLNIVDPQRGY